MADVDLSTLSFFEGFDRASLDEIEAMGEPVEVEPGAVITEQGRVGQEAYVVRRGEVEVVVNGHTVATAGPGSLLGEMALLDLRPRSATLVARTPVELISYGSEQFRAIVEEMPSDVRARLVERDERFRSENLAVADEDRPSRITR